ncbi:MAG: hydrolase, partial [Eudoraea sp.]
MRVACVLFVILCILCNTTYLYCQVTESTYDTADRPIARAIPVKKGPVIDGEVMDDEIWKEITPFGNLYQVQPNFGNPAS